MEMRPGKSIEGFEILSIDDLGEYNSQGVRFVHSKTGMDVYHVRNDDPENVFAYVFSTPPSDDTGVAHITEHSVLSGSKKFPVKDPFLALMKGSVNTFLNAMTYPDKTVYPAASPVHEDFFNLLNVYSDAVFNPLLKKEVFLQEGKRDVFDTDDVLDVTGVVFNEMKGAFSSFETVVADSSFRLLFPDTPYRYESGGLPESIRDLTYGDFIAFYEKYYHPSNCRLFLYGDLPSEEILSVVNGYIGAYSKNEDQIVIPRQKTWQEPRYFQVEGPSGKDASEKTTFTVNWRLTSLSDPLEILALEMLSEILLGNQGSPMYKALYESPYGEDLSPSCGIETDLQDLVFTLGVRGAQTEDRDKFIGFVFAELENLARSGIPRDIIEGAFTRVEFRNREIKGGFPFGLRLMSKSLRGWLHGLDPAATLGFEKHFQGLKDAYGKDGTYFEGLIFSYLIKNTHYSVVTVESTPDFSKTKEEEHLEWRNNRTMRLTEDERKAIIEDRDSFDAFQSYSDTAEDMEKIPSLSLGDIPTEVRCINSEKDSMQGRPLYIHKGYTNGIIYSDIAFPVGSLPYDEEMLLPFFCKILTSVGVGDLSYDQAASKLSLISGGLFSFIEISSNLKTDEQSAFFFVRMKALADRNEEALRFLGRIFTQAKIDDKKRIKDLLVEYRNELRSSLISAGHSFALLRAGSRLSPALQREECWRGIRQFLYVNDLADAVDERIGDIVDIFASIKDRILVSSRAICNITCESGHTDEAKEGIYDLLRALPQGSRKKKSVKESGCTQMNGTHEAFIVPTAVNYVAAVVPGSLLGAPGYAYDALIAHLLKTEQLWEKIRMQGGAYGAFSSINGTEGIFSFGSYRDPHIVRTYNAYKEALEDLETKLSEADLEKAKISILGKEFKPLAPGEMSMIGFRRELYGIDDDMRQRKHMSIYEASMNDIVERVRELAKLFEKEAVAVVVGSDKDIRKAAEEMPVFADSVVELI